MKWHTRILFALAAAVQFSPSSTRAEVDDEGLVVDFTAEVLSISPVARSIPSRASIPSYNLGDLRRAKEKTIVVGIDARWKLVARVVGAEGKFGPFNEGDMVSFVIKSPVRSLSGEAEVDRETHKRKAIGKQLKFKLSGRNQADGNVVFHTLECV